MPARFDTVIVIGAELERRLRRSPASTARNSNAPASAKPRLAVYVDPRPSLTRANVFQPPLVSASTLTRSPRCEGLTRPCSVTGLPVSTLVADVANSTFARTRCFTVRLRSPAADTYYLRLVCTNRGLRTIR